MDPQTCKNPPLEPPHGTADAPGNSLAAPGVDDVRLLLIADLLTELPETERREAIAELSLADRLAVAKLIIRQTKET